MPSDYLTQHYDNQRTGWNPHETSLAVASVRHGFHLLFTQPVDGQVYAQPLVVGAVAIPGKGTHDAVYVATEGDSVYAFDAHANMPALWHRRLVPPGETPLSSGDVAHCGNIHPQIGITATPVIDRAANTLYVVTKTKAGPHFHQRLHALDLGTGGDKHPSHNSAKKALEFTVAIPRAELRPRYGAGFAGAPVEQRGITRARRALVRRSE